MYLVFIHSVYGNNVRGRFLRAPESFERLGHVVWDCFPLLEMDERFEMENQLSDLLQDLQALEGVIKLVSHPIKPQRL